jgi:2-phospho-L-lactate guanylyltransferase
VWVLVPVKRFAEAKERLSSVLGQSGRNKLARAMLAHTLGVLQQSNGIAGIVVVSRDSAALRLAKKHGAHSLRESTTGGLNAALAEANQFAIEAGANATLVIPIDLPTLAAADIEEIARAGSNAPCVVVSPAAHDGGTNALLVNPAGLIAYAFGADSFAEHRRRAQQVGAQLVVYASERVSFDVDQPADLARMPSLHEM